MRIMLTAAGLGALIALAGCGRDEVSLENATANQVADAVKASGLTEMKLRPGKWEYSMAITEMTAPGMPPEIAAQMKDRMAATRVTDKCLTAADVDKLDAHMGEMPQNCRFDHYKASAGKMDARMVCQQQGMTQEMTMAGTYSATSSDMTMTSKTSGAGPIGAMTMTVTTKGRRVGDCEAPPAGAAN